MRHWGRAVVWVLPSGFVAFCVLFVLHRVGEGDSFSQSARLDFGPVVSSSSGAVVFASFQTGRGDLYSMDENGNRTQQLTRNNDCESGPAFSPNGRQIAYIKETPQAWSINVYKGQAWIMNADGSHAHAVTHDETNYTWLQFSADGNALYLMRETPDFAVARSELFRVDLAGDSLPVLVPGGKNREPAPVPKRDEWATDLSPDRRQKLSVFWSRDYQALRVAPVNGSAAAHTILKLKTDLSNPCFSKDGHWLFFHEGNRFGPIALSKVAVDGSGYQRIARTSR